MKHLNRVAMAAIAISALCGLSERAYGQSFNIDIDIGFGDPGLGNGAPSESFGGAAGQAGYWNRAGYGGDPQALSNLAGAATGVQMSYTTGKAGSGGGGAHRFEGNTGDYALLLNDAVSVAPLISGGHMTFLFDGLQAGHYTIYTYAASINGVFMPTPVEVFGGTPPLELVTGPMPGNSYEHLVTHSIHKVGVYSSGQLQLRIVQPPNSPFAMDISGFQLLMVPEMNSGVIVGFGILLIGVCRTGHRLKHFGRPEPHALDQCPHPVGRTPNGHTIR